MDLEKITNQIASGLGFGIAGFFSGLLYSQNIDTPIAVTGMFVGLLLSAEFTRKEI